MFDTGRDYTHYSTQILDPTRKPFDGRYTTDSTWETAAAADERARELSPQLIDKHVRVIGHWTMEMAHSRNGISHCQNELACYIRGRLKRRV